MALPPPPSLAELERKDKKYREDGDAVKTRLVNERKQVIEVLKKLALAQKELRERSESRGLETIARYTEHLEIRARLKARTNLTTNWKTSLRSLEDRHIGTAVDSMG